MKVAVLGGGAAGLAAGAALKRAGVEVTLFEAEPEVGGKLRTVERDGFRCEDGPNSLTAQSRTALRMAQEHEVEIAPASRPRTRYVVRGGKMRALAPPRLAGLLSAGGWARLALEPLAVLRPSSRRKARQDESLSELMTRHLGADAGGLASTLLANGVYGGDPRLLSARDAFPRLSSLTQHSASFFIGALRRSLAARGHKTDGDQPSSLWIPAKGMSALARALAEEIGAGVRPGTRVQRLEIGRVGELDGPAGYDVAAGDGLTRVDGVICAIPPGEAARLLMPLAPAAEALKQIRSSPLSVVHLGFRIEDFARKPDGFGVLDGEDSLGALGILFPSSLFAGRAPERHVLFTSLVGGILHPETIELDDATLVQRCRADLQKLFGVTQPPVFDRVARWREAVPQPELGHRERVARVREALAILPPLELAGGAYDGVSVEQVLEGGERAAERLLGRLRISPRGGRVAVDPDRSPAENRVEV